MTLALCALVAGCEATGGLSEAPRPKPATISLKLEGPTEDTSTLASLSTGSGELLILENDGSVTKTRLDSPRGRAAIRQSDAEMFSLSDVLVSDDSIVVQDLPKPPRAQDVALEQFAARTRPALPDRIVTPPPEAFLRNRVRRIVTQAPEKKASGRGRELVSVLVNLRQGVDESAAFAYATCTLAEWSRTTDTPYARHIRTLTREADGVLAVEAVYMMSGTAPLGLRVMEQRHTLQACRSHGIPTRLTGGSQEGTGQNG